MKENILRVVLSCGAGLRQEPVNPCILDNSGYAIVLDFLVSLTLFKIDTECNMLSVLNYEQIIFAEMSILSYFTYSCWCCFRGSIT